MSTVAPVLIAGGGIGGLAAGIALAQCGIEVRILERRNELSEAGAGIQLGPNAVRVLRRLGVADKLAPRIARPLEIVVHDGASASVLARLPLGEWIERQHGAPYWLAHRRDVQAALLARAAELPLLRVTAGFAVVRVETARDRVKAESETGDTAEGGALVVADGQFSRLRREHFGAPPLRFCRKTAARTVLDASTAADLLDASCTGVWLAADAHVVHYPVRAGRDIAVVAIIDEDWQDEEWGAPADRDQLMAKLACFAPRLADALGRARDWRRWALFDAEPLRSWSDGRVALLGDAAHPTLPFLAQGAAMALEDAVTLAECLHEKAGATDAAFDAYQQLRMPRTARVMAASRRNGSVYHLSGLAALARNAALRTLSGARVMARYDWLYGWGR